MSQHGKLFSTMLSSSLFVSSQTDQTLVGSPELEKCFLFFFFLNTSLALQFTVNISFCLLPPISHAGMRVKHLSAKNKLSFPFKGQSLKWACGKVVPSAWASGQRGRRTLLWLREKTWWDTCCMPERHKKLDMQCSKLQMKRHYERPGANVQCTACSEKKMWSLLSGGGMRSIRTWKSMEWASGLWWGNAENPSTLVCAVLQKVYFYISSTTKKNTQSNYNDFLWVLEIIVLPPSEVCLLQGMFSIQQKVCFWLPATAAAKANVDRAAPLLRSQVMLHILFSVTTCIHQSTRTSMAIPKVAPARRAKVQHQNSRSWRTFTAAARLRELTLTTTWKS